MNAIAAEEFHMVVEDRIARLETDVVEIKSDLKILSSQVSEVKIDVAKEFGAVRAELRDFKTEVAREFGSVRTEMKSLGTSIERTKVWMLTTGLATLLGVAAIVGLKSH